MTDLPDLTALVGSRICHDLISPIGAIGNGVELMSMDTSNSGPELTLISESVANANARIRFFRIAFGASSPGQRVGRPEALSILSDLTRGSRLSIDWQAPGDQARRDVKAAFLMIQCLETAMPYGGRITVSVTDGIWHVVGEATKTRQDDRLWSALAQRAIPADLSPAQVHFALLARDLAAQDRQIALMLTETRIDARF